MKYCNDLWWQEWGWKRENVMIVSFYEGRGWKEMYTSQSTMWPTYFPGTLLLEFWVELSEAMEITHVSKYLSKNT